MNCHQVQASLTEDLTSRSDDALVLHLRGCIGCRRYCEDLLELEDLSRSLSGRFRVPASFQQEVLARAAKEKPTRRLLQVGFAVGAAVLLMISVGFLLQASGEEKSLDHPEALVLGDQKDWVPAPGQSSFHDIVVVDDVHEGLILRLPPVIEIHRSQPQEDFYINNVSH